MRGLALLCYRNLRPRRTGSLRPDRRACRRSGTDGAGHRRELSSARLFVERLGRRRLAIWPQSICAAALLLIGLWTGAPAWVVLVGFLVFSCFNAMCATLTGVFPAEIFPTEIRGIGPAFAAAISRIGAALGTFLLPWAIATFGAALLCLLQRASAHSGLT